MVQALLEQSINGLMMGSIYVLVGLGLVLIYSVMNVLNFAHGALFMLGGYLAHLFFTRFYANYPLAVLFAAVGLVLVGSFLEHFVFKPLRDNLLNQVIAALGLVLIIQNLVKLFWGPTALFLKIETTKTGVPIGYARFSLHHILIIAVTFFFVGLLYLFLGWTKLGTAIRATSQDRNAAYVVGIRVDLMYKLSFVLGSLLAAVGGALLGPLFLFFPQMGDLPLVKALAGILLGGMGSVIGAVVGGLVIGVSESVATIFIPSDYRDTITFLVIIGILLLRPHGLFRQPVREEP